MKILIKFVHSIFIWDGKKIYTNLSQHIKLPFAIIRKRQAFLLKISRHTLYHIFKNIYEICLSFCNKLQYPNCENSVAKEFSVLVDKKDPCLQLPHEWAHYVQPFRPQPVYQCVSLFAVTTKTKSLSRFDQFFLVQFWPRSSLSALRCARSGELAPTRGA